MAMRGQQCLACHIARTLYRSLSVITRELNRLGYWQDFPALMSAADGCFAGVFPRRQRFKPRRCSKFAVATVLFSVVQQYFMSERWPSSKIAGTFKRMWNDSPKRTVSRETINSCFCAVPHGEISKDRIAFQRRDLSKRMPRLRGEDSRGQMPEVLGINVRPAEVSSQTFPGHWEGDLIKVAGNRSAAGVLIERNSHLVMPPKLANAKAVSAMVVFTTKLRSIAH